MLQYLDSLDNACLNFKLLSCKTAILLTILSWQRVSTIHAFRLSQLQLTTDMAIFNLGTTLLKHSRPGRSTPPIVFHRYPHGRRLCPLQIIQDYVTQRTLLAPQIDKFFITHRKPYHPASKDTLARWVKDMLHFSGIDTSHYAAHSWPSASSSNARVSGVPMEQILKCGQWKSPHTFIRFYNKDIVRLTHFVRTGKKQVLVIKGLRWDVNIVKGLRWCVNIVKGLRWNVNIRSKMKCKQVKMRCSIVKV